MGSHKRPRPGVAMEVPRLRVDLAREECGAWSVRVGDPDDPAPGTLERVYQCANLGIGHTGLVGQQDHGSLTVGREGVDACGQRRGLAGRVIGITDETALWREPK